MKAFALSNRMYAVLGDFAKQGALTLQQVYAIDQRPMRALLIRNYITYSKRANGFVLTKIGLLHWDAFLSTDVGRLDTDAPLAKVIQERTGIKGRRAA